MTDSTDAPTLVLSREGEPVFSAAGRWLYPIFELEEFLLGTGTSTEGCVLYDKMIGKAAAFLIARLGITMVETDLVSRRGEAVLRRLGIALKARRCVDRLTCMTEELLDAVESVDDAYALLRARVDAHAESPQ